MRRIVSVGSLFTRILVRCDDLAKFYVLELGIEMEDLGVRGGESVL